ncbi:MAG: hypothetical protein AAGB12_02675 [Pseudomonadota bacterium]
MRVLVISCLLTIGFIGNAFGNKIPREESQIQQESNIQTLSNGEEKVLAGNTYVFMSQPSMKSTDNTQQMPVVFDVKRQIMGPLSGKIVVKMKDKNTNAVALANQFGMRVSIETRFGYVIMEPSSSVVNLYSTLDLLGDSPLIEKAYLDIANQDVRPM